MESPSPGSPVEPPPEPTTATPDSYLHGIRLGLTALPAPVSAWLARAVGGEVLEHSTSSGGMSTSLASVVRGPRGRFFVKGDRVGINPFADQSLDREIAFHRNRPALPHVPDLVEHALIEVSDETPPAHPATPHQDAAGAWHLALFEAAPGSPVDHPWRPADLLDALDAWSDLAPHLADLGTLGGTDQGWRSLFAAWDDLLADPSDPWHPDHPEAPLDLSRFVEPARAWLTADLDRPVLAHIDLRADNILTMRAGASGVSFIDWAHPELAEPWLDPLLLVLDAVGSGTDVAAAGASDLRALWASHPLTRVWPVDLLELGAATLAVFLHVRRGRPTPFSHKLRWIHAMSANLAAFATSPRRG